jgi:hypothetical protein
MATSDEIGRERQRVSEQLARLDAERAKLANELRQYSAGPYKCVADERKL